MKLLSRNETIDDAITIGYCSHCGREVDQVFTIGDFCLIEQPGQRPYYGRITSVQVTRDGPMTEIERGLGDKELCHVDYVRKVVE